MRLTTLRHGKLFTPADIEAGELMTALGISVKYISKMRLVVTSSGVLLDIWQATPEGVGPVQSYRIARNSGSASPVREVLMLLGLNPESSIKGVVFSMAAGELPQLLVEYELHKIADQHEEPFEQLLAIPTN